MVASVTNPCTGDQVSVSGYSGNIGTVAGSYSAKATALNNANYTLIGGEAVTHPWNIKKSEATVSIRNASARKGSKAEDLVIELDLSAILQGDRDYAGTPAFTLTDQTQVPVTTAEALATGGTYTITWTNPDAVSFNANYEITKTLTATLNVYEYIGGNLSPLPTKNLITVSETENGTVTVSETEAYAEEKVTVTVAPEKGWTLETLTVKTAAGKEVELTAGKTEGIYSFEMPASAVTVKATFMEDNTMLNFFVDVTADDFYYDAVLWAAQNGITSGVDETHFDPHGATTRAQMVTFLWKAAGQPVVNYALDFADVPADCWYTEAVRWAVSEGLVKGNDKGLFDPDTEVDRAQIVTLLYRFSKAPAFANMTANGPAPSPFEDVSNTEYYFNAVLWAVGEEITEGTGNGFAPTMLCDRAQMVTFLYRYFVK